MVEETLYIPLLPIILSPSTYAFACFSHSCTSG
jgi:hypothetical protein